MKLFTSSLLLCSVVGAAAALASESGLPEPELALQFDFFDVQGALVPDGSGHGHHGRVVAGTIVSGKRKPAVQFDGAGMVTTDSLAGDVDLARRSITVGAMCKPAAPDGVIASMGDSTDGFSLYLKDGVPRFAVRSRGVIHEVANSEPVELGRWVHLAGVIGTTGELSLLVNAFPVAKAAEPSFLTRTPAGRFSVGADADDPVAAYSAALHWHGLLEDVRLYRGEVNREAHRDLLGDWANRPGCGCRK